MIILTEEKAYPIKGDKFILDENTGSKKLAWLNKDDTKFSNLANFYQIGAIELLDKAISDENLADKLVYPAFFTIRHYLELRMKEILINLNYCLNDSETLKLDNHRILPLWHKIVELYGKIGENNKNDEFRAMTKLMEELEIIDSNSIVFRYPNDVDGKKIQKIDWIDLENLKEIFVKCAFLLDCLGMQIHHYKDIATELNGEYYFDNIIYP